METIAAPRLEDVPAIPSWLAAHYPFRRRVMVVNGLRLHFVDEGQGRPVLMLHGNPTWSFLWRKVVPGVVAGGLRAVAPDLPGLGLSDKPQGFRQYTLEWYVDTLVAFVEALDLRDTIIVGQDWGGPIVAALAARRPARVSAAVFANTSIVYPKRVGTLSAFHALSHIPVLSDLLFRGLGFPIPILDRVQGNRASIGPLEKRAYAYPLGSWRDRIAPLALARMVPNRADHRSLAVLRETDQWARQFAGPVALVWGLRDPILGRSLRAQQKAMPHAQVTETQAGHFLQEEVPDSIVAAILSVQAASSAPPGLEPGTVS